MLFTVLGEGEDVSKAEAAAKKAAKKLATCIIRDYSVTRQKHRSVEQGLLDGGCDRWISERTTEVLFPEAQNH